jgi:hypothetical protein
MTIRVECPECGFISSVADKAAGRKLKCSCGGVISVPEADATDDDFERPSGASRPRSRSRKSSRSEETPILKWVLIGGGGLAIAFVLFILFRTVTADAVWQSDPALAANLDAEQSASGFAIRPPKGWRVIGNSNQVVTSGGLTQQVSTTRWGLGNPQGGELVLEVISHPNIRGKTQPINVHTTNGTFSDNGNEPMLIVTGGTISRGKVNDRLTTRLAFQNPGATINLQVSAHSTGLVYITYFDDKRVNVEFGGPHAPDSIEYRTLEESLKSLRQTGANDPPRMPAAAPQQMPPPVSTLPPSIASNFPAKPGVSPIPGQPDLKPSGFNNSTANSVGQNSTPGNDSGTAETKKSGGIVATIPKTAPKSGFKSADWGGAEAAQKGQAAGKGFGSAKEKSAGWGDSAEIIAQTPGNDVLIEYPATESQFVLVGKEVRDVKSGDKIGEFPIGVKAIRGQFRALSPDGKLVASAAEKSTDTGELATLNELGGKGFGKTLKLADAGKARDSLTVQFIEFIATNRLVVGASKFGRAANRIVIFNTDTGKVAKDIQCPEVVPTYTVTADGKFLAMFTRNEIPVYDLQKGQKVASMELPPSDTASPAFRNPGNCHGLAFSPDGSELAALLDGTRILAWSAKGKIIYDEVLARQASTAGFNVRGGVVWLPDQSGWILGKQYLFDREKKMLLWQLVRTHNPFDEQPVKMVDQGSILAHIGDHNNGELTKIAIPWEQIQQSLGGENWESLALVKPGDSLSVSVDVFNVRFAQPQEVANVIGTALTKRIERSKFKVGPDKEVILKAVYNEEQGANKRVVERRGFSPFGGRDTGMTVNDTKGKLEIKIVTKGKGEVVWEQTIYSDGGSTIKDDVSDAGVRKQMFDMLSYRVNQLALPTMIPKPGGPLLPIVTDRSR